MAVELPLNGAGQTVDTFTTAIGREKTMVGVGSGLPANNFQLVHTPAAAAQATISQAAGGAGVRNVCTGISASLCTVGTAQAAAVQLNLRDGATGAGTILWSKTFSCGTTTMISIDLTNLHIFGSAATAMTLEFSAAGVSGSFESVSLTGYVAN
jgi:hypothetical protein